MLYGIHIQTESIPIYFFSEILYNINSIYIHIDSIVLFKDEYFVGMHAMIATTLFFLVYAQHYESM